jgi:hypothetical protein
MAVESGRPRQRTQAVGRVGVADTVAPIGDPTLIPPRSSWPDQHAADPEKAARRILEIANAIEPIQGRIHIEKINEPFLFRDRGSPPQYGAGLKLAIERGWLKMHESGTFVTFTPADLEMFA